MFPASIVGVLGNPNYLILPKVMNVVAACAVLGLLALRWLPLASKERAEADANMRLKTEALNQEAEATAQARAVAGEARRHVVNVQEPAVGSLSDESAALRRTGK